ncbi:MAG: sigma-54-dependent Fis family transcriptional regulator [Sedimentisphaerales bacterium]|nr:sigma-54-dependent Fis family transcriptional regulator [Sedimentisphaerales bacterium]MBN2841722.1 sigma-54-dependent Fis family transcriptional regulator [Sedimentisphaerales bacterium]
MADILVVDDMELMRDSLEAILSRSGHKVIACEDAVIALDRLKTTSFDLIITDLKMPKMDGIAFMDRVRSINAEVPVIMMTAHASVSTAVEAMRKGALDYIQKPFDADEIILLVDRSLEHKRIVRENEAYKTDARDWQKGRTLIGSGPVMQSVMTKVRQVAPTSATVLIRGECGTGKEMIARAIHSLSPRTSKPMLCVNCAALSSSLLESELFGHEKGAFTGADSIRKGRFELADGGTLLLDEISEMDMQLQSKLLRVLQEREFERVGSSITRPVNVRILATTNRDLESWVAENKFREDLFYRLNVVPITIPPLRERGREDISLLCDYFLGRIAQREGRRLQVVSESALDLLAAYNWPGNVRELENLMERVAILSEQDVISPDLIRNWLDTGSIENDQECAGIEVRQIRPLAELEREAIEHTLEKFDGHRQKTAEALGIGIRTLGLKLKKWADEGMPVGQ